MQKTKLKTQTELRIRNILGFIQKKVTPFGTGAKVDCPKEYMGRTVYLVIIKNGGNIK
jgi:putative transposon-encoded protein